MGSLADEARALSRKPGVLCRVALIGELTAEVDEALAAGISAASLSRALRARGIEVPEDSLTRHRRGDCRCRS